MNTTHPHFPTLSGTPLKAAPAEKPTLDETFEQILSLHQGIVDFEQSMRAVLDRLHQQHTTSARNLLHYVAMRRHDIRALQAQLSALGLSSLGRSEACLLATLQRILTSLAQLADKTPPHFSTEPPVQLGEGEAVLTANTVALFGPEPEGRPVRIMVTMATEAAHSYEHVRELLASGMNCMRINCAHDDVAAWTKMIEHLHRAREELQKPCSLLMDLAGPKLRTGPIAHGPAVHKWRPTRDALGRVVKPVRVRFTETDPPPVPAEHADFHIRVAPGWLERMRAGDCITFKDARGASRKVAIQAVHGDHAMGECRKTAYLVPGLKLRLCRRDRKAWRRLDEARLSSVPPTPQALLLKLGERLLLTPGAELGQPAVRDDDGHVLEQARIGCTLPQVFPDLQVNEPIWFDDGKIGGRIVALAADGVEVEITQAAALGSRLAADKGINLPNSTLRLPSLTPKDIDDLHFVVRHADLVGYSFVRTPQDVEQLQEQLHTLGGDHVGIILKIETPQAFDHLPDLLLTAMHAARAGVMIARGDLAIECGYERLAEVQEEILWFCEAAHVPVIWATEVLAHLAKEGIPSRAEITDAAMGERAECVMLNKGPHVVEAVQTLDNILKRMAAHQVKKRSMLRPLQMAGRFGK